MADDTVIFPAKPAAEEAQPDWNDLKFRVAQLEAEKTALAQDNKALRFMLERVIDHRQKSHTELVNLLAGLVGKLPINDVGTVVSKLVEHNANVNQYLAALLKGTPEAELPKPAMLKNLEQTKRDLTAALKPLVEELIRLETPLETALVQGLATRPESYLSPRMVQANRCFFKGHLPRERITREFGEEALVLFNDVTTDKKLNPRPNPEEIVLAFKNDFEILLTQQPNLPSEKRDALMLLYQRVQRSKGQMEVARAQKNTFLKLLFILELLHFYEHQNTETPDVVFAQRLPALIEQLVLAGTREELDEKLIAQAETLLAPVINPDHRQTIINNIGKSGGPTKTLKYVLKLRAGKMPDLNEFIAEFVRHLISVPPQKPPPTPALAATLRLLNPEMQQRVAQAVVSFDRIPKNEALALGNALAKELNFSAFDEQVKAAASVSPEREREMAWDKIKALISNRVEPAAIAAAIRDRLNAKYDAEEVRQSWLILTEADPISLIKIFCQMPYLPDGQTDPVAQVVMETYIGRLTHEKYAATYHKVVNSLKNIFKTKPDNPMLLNFVTLVKWVDPEAANKLSTDIGMIIPG